MQKATTKPGPGYGTSRTTIRKIGNSRGIILNNSILSSLGLEEGSEIDIVLDGEIIRLVPIPQVRAVNTNLSTWGSQFKSAIGRGQKPDKNPFDSMINEFDNTDWK